MELDKRSESVRRERRCFGIGEAESVAPIGESWNYEDEIEPRRRLKAIDSFYERLVSGNG